MIQFEDTGHYGRESVKARAILALAAEVTAGHILCLVRDTERERFSGILGDLLVFSF